MDEKQGTGTRQPARGDGRRFVEPDSVLALTALDLLAAHSADGAAGESGLCPSCGRHAPCPTAVHARLVVIASGVDVAAPVRVADGVADRVPELPVTRIADMVVEVGGPLPTRDRLGAA
ncbi:hypothetical protein ACNTMW_14475 [Planosporangium sp. 12N6]|uniref:hypothetical protein n=1 Tax=Planosporangium spinosum TaxID=3402278 RepID=UPI003CEAD308